MIIKPHEILSHCYHMVHEGMGYDWEQVNAIFRWLCVNCGTTQWEYKEGVIIMTEVSPELETAFRLMWVE